MISIDIYVDGELEQTRELKEGVHSIGRSVWSDIKLRDKLTAKSHLKIEVQPLGFNVYAVDQVFVEGNAIQVLDTPSAGIVLTLGNSSTIVKINHDFVTAEDHFKEIESKPSKPFNGNDLSVLEDQGRQRKDKVWINLKKDLQNIILDKFDLYKRAIIDGIDDDQLRKEAIETAKNIIAKGELAVPDDINKVSLINETVAESIGLGPLEYFLDDESITEIMVNGPDQIFIEKSGKLLLSEQGFTSNRSLQSVIERIVTPLGRRIDEGSPMVDARLKDGSRVNAIIPPLSLNGPILTIRKFSKEKYNLSSLVAFGSLSDSMVQFLENCVKYKKNIVVCGGTGSGKTTFLNALSNYVPTQERIITIEDAAELQLNQDHVISLESRPANTEKTGEVAIRDLVKNSLRMRPDRIIVGECRGAEALDMLQAMNTGHEGSMTTAHSNSPRDLLSRLEVMVLMSGLDLPIKVVREQIASAVDIIVHQSRFSDGVRRVTSIVEVDGMEDDVVLMQKIFEFNQHVIDDEGRVHGHFKPTGMIPKFYNELSVTGIELDIGIFK